MFFLLLPMKKGHRCPFYSKHMIVSLTGRSAFRTIVHDALDLAFGTGNCIRIGHIDAR